MEKNKINLKLPDGRNLCYAEFGQTDAPPLFLVHGNPSSRLFFGILPGVSEYPRARIIASDRPGSGYSDRLPENGEGPGQYYKDIAHLADELGFGEFTLAGISGGGPSAVNIAWKLGSRVKRLGLISAIGPFNKETVRGMGVNRHMYRLAKIFPRLFALQNHMLIKKIKKDPDWFMGMFQTQLKGTPDEEALSDPELVKGIAMSMGEGLRQESRPFQNVMTDDFLESLRWRVPLDEITQETHIWHGDKDQNIGDMSRYMAAKIPNVVDHFFPGGGHFLFHKHMLSMLNTLME